MTTSRTKFNLIYVNLSGQTNRKYWGPVGIVINCLKYTYFASS